ncbi:MAG: RIP metalloprotease RseP [Bacilli bacterium]|nr:RIP metalloprotease RseP [Bacilli bacterium]
MTLLYFILVLGVTIFIHELGHFLFAKKAGIYVYEFSLGMGPRLLHFKRKNDETEYSLRLLPIGGYVQMAGEEIEADERIPVEKRMQSKAWWPRCLTVIAGVVFNFLLALFLLFVVALLQGAPDNKPYIGKVYKGYPASSTKLKAGDQIISLNGKKVSSSDMFLLNMSIQKGKELDFTVKHKSGKTEDITIKAKAEKNSKGEKEYHYGFALDSKIAHGILPSIKYAFAKTGALIDQMVHIILYLFSGELGLNNLAGPVGIYTLVGQTAQTGFINILYLIAYLCINVGFINIMPIPAFDGGRFLFMIIEKIRGKQINPSTENLIHGVTLVFLMIFMLLITVQDITRLFT